MSLVTLVRTSTFVIVTECAHEFVADIDVIKIRLTPTRTTVDNLVWPTCFIDQNNFKNNSTMHRQIALKYCIGRSSSAQFDLIDESIILFLNRNFGPPFVNHHLSQLSLQHSLL